jgi:hypothetical protein
MNPQESLLVIAEMDMAKYTEMRKTNSSCIYASREWVALPMAYTL